MPTTNTDRLYLAVLALAFSGLFSPPLLADDDEPQQKAEASAEPGTLVVDEDAAVRALESALLRADALLLPAGAVSVSLDVSAGFDSRTTPFLANATDTDPESEEETSTVILATADTTVRRFTSRLSLDFGLPLGFQFGASLPFGNSQERTDVLIEDFVIEDDLDSDFAVGDLELSLQRGFSPRGEDGPDLIAGLAIDTGLGSSDGELAGVSTGTVEYRFSLTATARQDPLVFSGTVAQNYTPAADGQDDTSDTTFVLGTYLAASPYTSLSFEFRHSSFARQGDDGRFRANRGTAGTLSIGGASVIGHRTSLTYRLGAGLSDAADDYTISLALTRDFR